MVRPNRVKSREFVIGFSGGDDLASGTTTLDLVNGTIEAIHLVAYSGNTEGANAGGETDLQIYPSGRLFQSNILNLTDSTVSGAGGVGITYYPTHIMHASDGTSLAASGLNEKFRVAGKLFVQGYSGTDLQTISGEVLYI